MENKALHVLEIGKLSLVKAQQEIDAHGAENIAFRMGRGEIIHIGALCYRKRRKTRNSAIYEILPTDLDANRVKAITAWAIESITDIKTGNLREKTFTSYAGVIFQLVRESERKDHDDLFHSEEKYQQAYDSFAEATYEKLLKGTNKAHTARIKQSYPLAAAYKFFPDSEYIFTPPKNRVSTRSQQTKGTEIPLDSEVAHATSSCSALFHQLTDALINRTKYPFQINFQNHDIWIVPNKDFCKPNGFESSGTSKSGWNYEKGTVALSVERPIGPRLTALERENRCAELKIKGHHHHELSRWAHNCFLHIFVANTGINEDQIIDLEWDSGSYEIIPHLQGFRTIKWRAGNKVQSFIITTNFVKDFEKYLQLREYILDGSKFNTLFITIPLKNRQKGVKPLQVGALTKLQIAFRQRFDSKYPCLGYRKLRLYKYNYLLTNYGITVASQLMQSSLGTIAKAYSSAEEGKATVEISAFYNLFSETVCKYQESTPVGHCTEPGNPSTQLIDIAEVSTTDCKDFITCLFCKNFVAHATETDARKLVSLKYFLNEIKTASVSSDEFEKINGPTINKINQILKELKGASEQFEEILAEVQETVHNNEQLSDYWGALLDKFVNFGGIK
ncbi:integrase [Pseudomonas sp. Irchel s3b2]|uniref:integrase n=1 Tax=Pseudomonas sp. Irchel s3b2 TaxID=2009073 RepID=UPI0011407CE2|nr:integrase [Pseudomonas sp. Irchel s3b2]